MANDLLHDFLLGFIRIHILYHAQREPIYGQDFKQELARHGYEISFGTLYPILHDLEEQGYLVSKIKTIKGKVRRYYSITSRGVKALKQSRHKAKALFNELF